MGCTSLRPPSSHKARGHIHRPKKFNRWNCSENWVYNQSCGFSCHRAPRGSRAQGIPQEKSHLHSVLYQWPRWALHNASSEVSYSAWFWSRSVPNFPRTESSDHDHHETNDCKIPSKAPLADRPNSPINCCSRSRTAYPTPCFWWHYLQRIAKCSAFGAHGLHQCPTSSFRCQRCVLQTEDVRTRITNGTSVAPWRIWPSRSISSSQKRWCVWCGGKRQRSRLSICNPI